MPFHRSPAGTDSPLCAVPTGPCCFLHLRSSPHLICIGGLSIDAQNGDEPPLAFSAALQSHVTHPACWLMLRRPVSSLSGSALSCCLHVCAVQETRAAEQAAGGPPAGSNGAAGPNQQAGSAGKSDADIQAECRWVAGSCACWGGIAHRWLPEPCSAPKIACRLPEAWPSMARGLRIVCVCVCVIPCYRGGKAYG